MFTVWSATGGRAPYVPRAVRREREVDPVRRIEGARADSEREGAEREPAPEGEAAARYRRAQERPRERSPAIVARQIMSAPVTRVEPTQSARDTWDLIRERRYRHVPVLAAGGRLVGMLSDRDLLRASDKLGRLTVSDLMTTDVLSAAPDTAIRRIARVMVEERIGAMPITEGDALVGIVTRGDILRAVVNTAPFELWI